MRNLNCDILNQVNKKDDVESLQEKQPLTFTQLALLEVIQLSPLFTVYGMLELTHNANITMAAFFISLIGLPILYSFIYKKDIKSTFFGDGMDKIGHQLKHGVLGGFGILAITFGSYYAFLGLGEDNHSWVMSRKIPVKKTFVDTAIFFLVFSFINPVLEELFWRAFLLKTFRDRKLAYVNITIHYALYHWFSIYYISSNCFFSTFITGAILILGAILMYLREKCGMVAAVLTHSGADMAIAFVCWHIYSGVQI
jgi:membrane protease YdiL (CAAX protease family)